MRILVGIVTVLMCAQELRNEVPRQPGTLKLIVFVLPDCPVCRSMVPYLKTLHRTYSQQGVHIVGYVPGNHFTQTAVDSFVTVYKIPFPVTVDTTQSITQSFGVWVVPQGVIVDENNAVVYRGRINDLYVALGKRRPEPTIHDVADRLDLLLRGTDIPFDTTIPVGCLLEY